MNKYTTDFYSTFQEGSRNSAKQIIPLLKEYFDINSVVDIGCGIGTWLSACKDLGITDLLGVDGDYVNRDQLLIEQNQFAAFDIAKKIDINRKFNLAISLEVGEHLPHKSAENYVKSLVNLSDVILFSAAIPYQGGENHVNCQWPEYWAALFAIENYCVVDLVRKRVWKNPLVEHWYAQNVLLFVQADYLKRNELLLREYELTYQSQLSLVHPKRYIELWELYDKLIEKQNKGLMKHCKKLVKRVLRNG
jgi:SAM-dependent methyltransferase